MTMGTPSCCDSCADRARISTSGAPPGADGTIRRIGFSGQAASAECSGANRAASARDRDRKRERMQDLQGEPRVSEIQFERKTTQTYIFKLGELINRAPRRTLRDGARFPSGPVGLQ